MGRLLCISPPSRATRRLWLSSLVKQRLIRDRNGDTALIHAVRGHCESRPYSLVNKDGNFKHVNGHDSAALLGDKRASLDATNHCGDTALAVACERGNNELAALLTANGAASGDMADPKLRSQKPASSGGIL